MLRKALSASLVLAACSADTTVGDTESPSTTDASSGDADSSATSMTTGMSMTSTSADGSATTDASTGATTGASLPCGCLSGEVCVERTTDACADPPIPNVSCTTPPPACDGVEFTCDSACGWETCGGPGCLGVGVEVCGVPSEGIVCAGGGLLCNVFDQTCPSGEKCSSWDADADGTYDATRCVPVVDPAVPVGGVCAFEGTRFTGIDDCELGAKCFPESPGDPTGICRAACLGNPFQATCADPELTCVLDGDWFAWCLPA